MARERAAAIRTACCCAREWFPFRRRRRVLLLSMPSRPSFIWMYSVILYLTSSDCNIITSLEPIIGEGANFNHYNILLL